MNRQKDIVRTFENINAKYFGATTPAMMELGITAISV
jgi:hypothetical protein